MPEPSRPEDKPGDALIESMQSVIGGYLSSPKAALTRMGSGFIERMSSSGDLKNKSTNVQVAMGLQTRLKTIAKNPDLSQEEKLIEARGYLIAALELLKETGSVAFQNALNDVLQQSIQNLVHNNFGPNTTPPNLFEDPNKHVDDTGGAYKDIKRYQHYMTFDGIKGTELTAETPKNETPQEKEVYVQTFENNWKAGKTEEQQALIEAITPYLHQNGYLQQHSVLISQTFLEKGLNPNEVQQEISFDMHDNELHATEHLIISTCLNMKDNSIITLEQPIVLTHEYTAKLAAPDVSADMSSGKDREPTIEATTTALYHNQNYTPQLKQDAGHSPDEPSTNSPSNSPRKGMGR